MIYRIYPQKDTTIYEDSTRKLQNVGKDEILEVGKFFNTDDTTPIGNSRILIQFDLSEISQSIVARTISGSIKYYLNLISSDEREIPSEYNLYIYPISQSWVEGLGSLSDTPHNENDSNWVYRSTNVSWSVSSSIIQAHTGQLIRVVELGLHHHFTMFRIHNLLVEMFRI